MVKNLFLLFTFFFVCNVIISQTAFRKDIETYLPKISSFSGVAGGFADINGDGYDDIITLDKGKKLFIALSQGNGNAMKWIEGPLVSDYSEYSLNIGDLDNDGLSEIMVGGFHGRLKVYKQFPEGVFTLFDQPQPEIFFQACNLVDINNDGYLDFYGCNDNGPNITLINDGTGKLVSQELIDWTTDPVSDLSGNYGSEWSDIDNDGDLDLYIAKCRFGVTNREDARRHNALFINEGGTFVNQAENRGLLIKDQSWSACSADYDNDGDLDFFVTNHDAPHLLMKNDGTGHFTNSNAFTQPLLDFAYQGIWNDFDNNGFEDILVTGESNSYVLFNQDGSTFVKKDDLFGFEQINSAVIGDVNRDGFYDIMAYYSTTINSPGVAPDILFINQGNDNHFIDIAFQGNSSNANGVGSRVKIYGPWGMKMREIRSGESYGITNSMKAHFGLGSSSQIDSVVIQWPSGIKDIYVDVQVDQQYLSQEGYCMSKMIKISDKDQLALCDTMSTTILNLPKSFISYLWNDGTLSDTVLAKYGNNYQATLQDIEGCIHVTNKIEIISGKFQNATAIISQDGADQLLSCVGEIIDVEANHLLNDVLWSNGTSGLNTEVESPISISMKAIDQCGNEVMDTLEIIKVITGPFNIKGDTVKLGENAILHAEGDDVKWFTSLIAQNPIFIGNDLFVANVQQAQNYYVQASATDGVINEHIGKKDFPTSTNEYSSDSFNGGLFFSAYKPFTIHSCKVKTDKAGLRRFTITSQLGDVVMDKSIMLSVGENTLILDVFIPIGAEYLFSTDNGTNLSQLGTNGPRLVRAAEGVSFPYLIEGVMEMITSLGGLTNYYYFFDMEISYGGVTCISDRIEVPIAIDSNVATQDISFNEVFVSPNPASDLLTIQMKMNGEYDIHILSLEGINMITQKVVGNITSIDLSHLLAGIYILEVVNQKAEKSIRKIIKQ